MYVTGRKTLKVCSNGVSWKGKEFMERENQSKQPDIIEDFFDKSLDNFCIITSLSKILLNILENEDCNIKERDKISLAVVLDRMIEQEKNNFDAIRTKLFGY